MQRRQQRSVHRTRAHDHENGVLHLSYQIVLCGTCNTVIIKWHWLSDAITSFQISNFSHSNRVISHCGAAEQRFRCTVTQCGVYCACDWHLLFSWTLHAQSQRAPRSNRSREPTKSIIHFRQLKLHSRRRDVVNDWEFTETFFSSRRINEKKKWKKRTNCLWIIYVMIMHQRHQFSIFAVVCGWLIE